MADCRRYHKRKHVQVLSEKDKLSRKRVDDDDDDDQVVTQSLCDDLIFQILLLLPTESLVKFQCVCKTWSAMINNSVFVKSHEGNNKSEKLLVNQSQNRKLEQEFCVLHLESTNMSIKSSIGGDGLGAIDSLNGMVLAITTDRRLLLVNPMTRKHIHLPENCHMLYDNIYKYCLVFCEKSKTYKVVHFFERQGAFGYMCEILTIGAKIWRTVDLPSNEFQSYVTHALFFGGSLYWAVNDAKILVVMNVQDEKFSIKNMSNSIFNGHRLMEIGGNLGIVLSKEYINTTVNIEVWFSESNEIWTKKYDILYSVSFHNWDARPICCSRDAKEIIFSCHSYKKLVVYAYNLVKHEYRVICTLDSDREVVEVPGKVIPHRNTLLWWE